MYLLLTLFGIYCFITYVLNLGMLEIAFGNNENDSDLSSIYRPLYLIGWLFSPVLVPFLLLILLKTG